MSNSCSPHHLNQIGKVKTTGGHDIHARASPPAEMRNRIRASEYILRSTRSQQAVGTSFNDRFQCFAQVHSLIERTVESNVQWTAEVDEFTAPFHIHGTIRKQDADSDTTGAGLLCLLDLILHQLKFFGRENEIAWAWTNKNMNWN
jgi:hypothetical protein